MIRSDNGPEFIADKLGLWLEDNGIGAMYIDPASPWQNPYVESMNAQLRDDCLKRIGIERLGANTCQEATAKALQSAVPGDVILFIPGGSSFDEFSSFEERGGAPSGVSVECRLI